MTILAILMPITALSTDTGDGPVRRHGIPGADVRGPGSTWSDPPATTEHLLPALGLLAAGHPDRGRLRARAIEDELPPANWLAHHYAARWERLDDLAQVAGLALVEAVPGGRRR